MSELPSSEDLDPSTGTDAPTPPTTTGPSSYTLNWEEPRKGQVMVVSGQIRTRSAIGTAHSTLGLTGCFKNIAAVSIAGDLLFQSWINRAQTVYLHNEFTTEPIK